MKIKGDSMSLISVIFIMFAIMAMTGCTFHANIPVVNIDASPPPVVKKIPLNVSVVVDETENISTKIQPDIIAMFPVGQLMKKASQDIFLHVFSKATIIKGRYYPPGTDALLVPKVKNFTAEMPYCGIAGCRSDISMSISFVLLDTKGMPVWETVINSSKSKRDPSPFATYGTTHGPAIAELIAEIFQKVAEEIAMSGTIHTYSSTKGIPTTVVSRETSPTIKSDID